MLSAINSINLYAASEIERGYSALTNKDLKKATQHFQIVLANDPESINAKLGLAKTYKLRGLKKSTQKLVHDILKNEPDNLEALLLEGQLHLWNAEWLQSQHTFEKIISLDEKNILAHTFLVQALSYMGKLSEADAIYEKLKKLQGNNK